MPIEAVREPVGKTVIKKFWNKSKRFGFVPKFLRLNGCFQKFWNTSERFGFVSKFLD